MKSISKVILLVAAASLTLTAVAGKKYNSNRTLIYSEDGFSGSSNINAFQTCYEYPDGMGGSNVEGFVGISGFIAGKEVSEFESYSDLGLDSCPENGNSIGGGSRQSATVSLVGNVVTADCTDQAREHSSSNGHINYPHQIKPQNYLSRFNSHYTYDPYDGSCVITATHSGGSTETFGTYTFVNGEESVNTPRY